MGDWERGGVAGVRKGVRSRADGFAESGAGRRGRGTPQPEGDWRDAVIAGCARRQVSSSSETWQRHQRA
jgi:hypothetical protein